MKIIIISSSNTGSGHKSIGEALLEQFEKHPEIDAKIIEGFEQNGALGSTLGKSYGFLTRRARVIWKAVWNISLKRPQVIYKLTEKTMEKNFIGLLEKEKPDLILSIHPNFNAPVLNILYKHRYKIPFITIIADLISITPLWVDPRADYIIAPTEEAKKRCIAFNGIASKIKVIKFPVRSRFYSSKMRERIVISDDKEHPLKFLLMSGGEGVGNLGMIAENLLEHFNCSVKIITGKNTVLKSRLESKYGPQYGSRLEVYGYITEVDKLMEEVDILISRGSPNVLMEAVASNLPIIVTGPLLGQEEENSYYIEQNNLGVVCKDYKELYGIVGDLVAENGKKLNSILEAQREYRDVDSVKKSVDLVIRTVEEFKYNEAIKDDIG